MGAPIGRRLRRREADPFEGTHGRDQNVAGADERPDTVQVGRIGALVIEAIESSREIAERVLAGAGEDGTEAATT